MKKQDLKKLAKKFIGCHVDSDDFRVHVEIQRAFELANAILDEHKRGDVYSVVHEMIPFDFSDFATYVMDQSEIFNYIPGRLVTETIELDYSDELRQLNKRIERLA